METWRIYHNTVSKLRASLLHSFLLVSTPSTFSSFLFLSHTLIHLFLSHGFVDVHASPACSWQQAVFAEHHSFDHHHRSTHRTLLTLDPVRSTCLLKHACAHTVDTSSSVSSFRLWRQNPCQWSSLTGISHLRLKSMESTNMESHSYSRDVVQPVGYTEKDLKLYVFKHLFQSLKMVGEERERGVSLYTCKHLMSVTLMTAQILEDSP